MGFAASFPLLALGQHGLVRLAGANIGVNPNGRYVVLGDDIVISDDRLHTEYRRLLQLYGIPVSEHKSITSDKLAEFAGFIITRDGFFKGTKLKSGEMNLDRMVSYSVTQGVIPKPLRKVRELYPLVYGLKEHGGRGLNPLGLPRDERAFWFEEDSSELLPNKVTHYQNIRSMLTAIAYRYEVENGQKPVHHVHRNAVHYVLKSYLSELEGYLSNRLKDTAFAFLERVPGVFQHAALEDSSFLIGMSPYMETVPATRKWVRKKYPYFFLLEREERCYLG
jgi:hypothetical protein